MKDVIQSDTCARKLRSLADPDRLRIIMCLRDGPKTVTDLAEMLHTSLANVSHHLGVLRQAQVVIDKKEGRFVSYRLNPATYQPTKASEPTDRLDLGCCQLEIPKPKTK